MTDCRASNEIAHGKKLAERPNAEDAWGWSTAAGRLRFMRRADLIVEGARLKAGMKAMEIGCGTGMFTEVFAKTGAAIVAVDISPDLLQLAMERDLSHESVTFVDGRFEECEVGSSYDAVIGSSVLHHLELDEALARAYELLKPGGRISFAEPNMLNPQVYIERRFSSLFDHVSEDETAFIRWGLKRSLSAAGFEDISIKPFDWLHPSTPTCLIKYVRRLGRIMENIPIISEFAGSLVVTARRPHAITPLSDSKRQ